MCRGYCVIFLLSVLYAHFFTKLKKKLIPGRAEEREKERETLIGHLLHVPQLGTEPAAQACALTGKQPFSLQDDAQPAEPHQPGLCARSCFTFFFPPPLFILTMLFHILVICLDQIQKPGRA